MSKLFCIAIPILPGKTEMWRKFTNELKGNRKKEFNESRKQLNVHERTFYQQTPNGDLVIVTLEGDEPEKFMQSFAQRNDEFSKWFLQNVKEVHGFDLTQPSQGPMPELIADTNS